MNIRDERLELIVDRLEAVYGLPRHSNLRDAFWELIFIILSVRTAERLYIPTYRTLRAKYRTIDALSRARLSTLRAILEPAGLSSLKAVQIRDAAKSVLADYGRSGLTRAGRREPEKVESYLMQLAGVGVKVAKCVTMYSCDSESLPVDAHVWRVMSRLGYAPGGRLTERKALALEMAVDRRLRFAVHVLCISHGRAVCVTSPRCQHCAIADLCPSSNV